MSDEHEVNPPSDSPQYAEPDTGEMPAEDVEAMNKTLPMILSFLVVPLLIVIVATGILLAFGMASYESVEPESFITMLQSGSANRRWQAAFELAKQINNAPEDMRARNLAPAIIELLETTPPDTEENRKVRQYLASCLGSLGDPAAIPALQTALDDPDPETRIYAITALGDLRAAQAADDLIAVLRDEDPGLVKAAAYSLGSIPRPDVADALAGILGHPVADVRWNAAVALAKQGDRRAAPVLHEMMDRTLVAQVPDIQQEQIEYVMTSGIRSAAALRLPDIESALTALAESDPNLRVRDAAFRALEALRAQPEALARTLVSLETA